MIEQGFLFHLTTIIHCWNPLSSMHRANLTIITIPVLLLAPTVAISVIVSEDAFARERYSGDSTSQAAAVSNDCLNPILDSNTIDNMVGVGNCGGTVSQQDESGQAGAPTTCRLQTRHLSCKGQQHLNLQLQGNTTNNTKMR